VALGIDEGTFLFEFRSIGEEVLGEKVSEVCVGCAEDASVLLLKRSD
jgi:hypothetical protein